MIIVACSFIVWSVGYFALMFLTRDKNTNQPNQVIGFGYPMATFLPMIALIGWLDKIAGGTP